MIRIIYALIMILAGVAALTSSVLAQDKNRSDKDKAKDLRAAVDRVNSASNVVDQIMRTSDRSIPRDLLAKTKAIVVFPGALKAAFILGGQGGKGVVIRRESGGWSAPAFLTMAGGSIGAQIGGQKTDYILLIMNDKGLKNLLKDKFEIGGEASVAGGPVGRTASASTNVTLDAEILSYSRSKGLFAGVALKGVVIAQDDDLNWSVYEKTGKEVIGTPAMLSNEAPATLQRLSRTVATYAR